MDTRPYPLRVAMDCATRVNTELGPIGVDPLHCHGLRARDLASLLCFEANLP